MNILKTRMSAYKLHFFVTKNELTNKHLALDYDYLLMENVECFVIILFVILLFC